MSKIIRKIDFRLNDIPRKLLGLGEAIIFVSRKLNELIEAHNELVREIEATKKDQS